MLTHKGTQTIETERLILRRAVREEVVSRFMRKFNFGIWQKSITGGASAPLDYISAVRAQRVKGGVSRSSCP